LGAIEAWGLGIGRPDRDLLRCMEEYRPRREPGRDHQSVTHTAETVTVASPPAPEDDTAGPLLQAGQEALDRFGVRLGLVFLLTSLVGVFLASTARHVLGAALADFAIGCCAAGLAYVLPRRTRWASIWLVALLVLTVLVTAGLAALPLGADWYAVHAMAGWMAAGMAGGIAASRGPWWGLAVFPPAVGAELLVEQSRTGSASALVFVGAFTFYVGAVATNVFARRGFVVTEQALTSVAHVRAEQEIAEERWRARRAADMTLHDTAVVTLTVLAHGGAGVDLEELRAGARLALDALSRPEDLGAVSLSESTAPSAGDDQLGVVAELVQAAVARATGLNLTLHVHKPSEQWQLIRLEPPARSALDGAIGECLANVARHSGVDQADLSINVTPTGLVAVVVDHGVGFNPAEVPGDRLGLRASVRERLDLVGGSAQVWSLRGQGTSVVMTVPRFVAS
jgi:signal transduction histidine kinase